MTIDFQQSRQLLQEFKFNDLFVYQLGWENPPARDKAVPMTINGVTYHRQIVAQLLGAVIVEITGQIPNANIRKEIYTEIAQLIALENLIIFTDKDRVQSIWYWVKREGTKTYPREQVYFKHQQGDLLLGKISALKIPIEELEAGNLSVIDIAERLQRGFDVERVTKRFFDDFAKQHSEFLSVIQGINSESDRRWYTSVILNRLMFVYFLQRKGFLDNNEPWYLQKKLQQSRERGEDRFYREFLQALFFEGFAKPENQRSPEAKALIGKIKYLNGGLFLKHPIEQQYPHITIPDGAFEKIFKLFEDYSWNLDDSIGGKDNEINPAVLGYIFEKYINQKAFGAYYTRPEITEYLCDRTINKLILDRVNEISCRAGILPATDINGAGNMPATDINGAGKITANDINGADKITANDINGAGNIPANDINGADKITATDINGAGILPATDINGAGKIPTPQDKKFESITELLTKLNANLCRHLINDILPNLSLLDPACGSGAFLVAAMKTLIYIYSAVIAKIEFMVDHNLTAWLRKARETHRSLNYFITKEIITKNLYGVDIMEEATEIAKLRLFLALVSCAHDVSELEPLPNIDFNIMAGNSLIGLMQVNDADYDSRRGQLDLFSKTYSQLLEEKNRLIATYRNATTYSEDLQTLRDKITAQKAEALLTLDEILLGEFKALKIKYEQAQLTGKAKKRELTSTDIKALQPFHWGYEFNDILQQRGGFDAIITNPPWEIFKPYAREFFVQHNELVIKSKMDIKAFEKEQKKLLQDPEIAAAWLDYQSQYPHVSAYYRSSEQYKNQISIVNGKKAGTDINLYKLFLEQCFNLLRPNGECGIVIPSGIYTDLGTKQLREMLFSQTKVTGLFCLENRKAIFEGVDSRFKIVVLTFDKSGKTTEFPSAFMRLDVQELQRFPSDDSLRISVEMVRKLSPDSLSVMEFKNEVDIRIAEKMLKFPLLGEKIDGKWNLRLTREFDMTNDSHLFHTEFKPGRLPLFTGKLFNQFNRTDENPIYWIDEKEGRKALLGRTEDKGQLMDYQGYRWVHRRIARNTDSRTLICYITPKNVFTEVNSTTLKVIETGISNQEMLLLCSITNSFTLDWMIRKKVSTTLNMFYVYQLPVPRLTQGDKYFNDIVQRAAKLICTTPEFDQLAQEVGLETHKNGVTDETERAKLRAELDGIIAHLYGLTEEEFTYILTTFPIVPDTVKQAAMAAYRTFAPMSGDAEMAQ